MKHTFKRVACLTLALLMVLALSATAFAADEHTDTYKGSGQPEATGVAGGNVIPLTKGIVLFNTKGSEIREPNISYTYTVTPLDETPANQGKPMNGITVTDDGSLNHGTPVTVTVNDGIAAAFTTPLTLTFSSANAKVAAAQDGTEVEKTGNLTITLGAFEHAGIYRYKITETVNPTDVTSVGLDARTSDYKDVRYLDVYIKNGASGLEMSGAVIFKTVESEGNAGKDPITTTTEKTTGFEPGKGGTGFTSYEDDKTVDKYHTFNLEVKKVTAGGLADMTHDFPFEITLTGNKAATIVADYSKVNATYVGDEPTTVNISTSAVTLTPALSNNDSVTITGIPVGTTVLVKETNDTYDQYTPTISTQTGFTGLTLTKTTPLNKDESTQLTAAAEITSKDANSVIELTNTIAEISPTGVVLRVAPYAIMLGFGLALMLFSRKMRKVED